MILLPQMKGKAVAVLGLGRTGCSAARSLAASGARVFAWDDVEEARSTLKAEAGVAATSPRDWPWDDIAALVLSPGIPFTHPEPHEAVKKAKSVNVSVLSDMELFIGALGPKGARTAPVIAVTGTNGKSTTAALIHHILRGAGYAAQLGGNIGRPVLDLEPPKFKTIYVLEVSSYQIDLTPSLAPEVGVLLNITPDHLERHGGFDGYASAKARLFDGQVPEDTAVVGIDDVKTSEICATLKLRRSEENGASVVPVSVGRSLGRGVFVTGGKLVDATSDPAIEVADLTGSSGLCGAHNWQNAAAAHAAARAVGVSLSHISEGIQSFPGLAHRQEVVAEEEGVIFVNDSKATNAEAASKALASYENIYWIAGGKAKEGGLDEALRVLTNVRKAYLIGEAADEFARALEGKVEIELSRTLDKAVAMAAKDARASGSGAVVLLSPACASFDQFTDFEARGDEFRKLAREAAASLRAQKAVST